MLTINKEKCSGCKTCSWVCPHGVLEMVSQKALISHPDRCVECGACQLNCAEKAITVVKGTGCLWIIVKEDILKMDKKDCCC